MPSSQDNLQPLVSVIIPAHNAEDTLPECLESVAAGNYPHMETIVVCDGCTDRSAEVAQEHGARVLHNDSKRGAAYARNVGAVVARGEILFFVDADCVLMTDTIGIAVRELSRDADVVFGSYIAETRAPGVYSKFKNYQHHFVHQNGPERPSTFWSGCGAVRRDVFDALQGFDSSLRLVEDIEFGWAVRQAGRRMRLLKHMQAEHLKRYTFRRLVHSDLFSRAIPWVRLVRAGRSELGTLNTARTGKVSTALAGLVWLLAGAAPFEPLAGAAALAGLGALGAVNRRFLRFLARQRGAGFACRCFGLLFVHYTICGLGFVLGHLQRPYPAQRNPAPEYVFSEHVINADAAGPGAPPERASVRYARALGVRSA